MSDSSLRDWFVEGLERTVMVDACGIGVKQVPAECSFGRVGVVPK
jgi:hypothetical protein